MSLVMGKTTSTITERRESRTVSNVRRGYKNSKESLEADSASVSGSQASYETEDDDYTDSSGSGGDTDSYSNSSGYSSDNYKTDYAESDSDEGDLNPESGAEDVVVRENIAKAESRASLKKLDTKLTPLVIKRTQSVSQSPERESSLTNVDTHASSASFSPSRSPTSVASPFQFQSGVLAEAPGIRYNVSPNFFGTIPASFKSATLGKHVSLGKGTFGESLFPFLDKSAFVFEDLIIEGKRHKLKPLPAKCNIGFSVLEANNIPVPGQDTLVIGRQVRLAVFDKTKVLSNVHTVPAIYNPDSPKVWKFSASSSILFPSDDENSCFVRVKEADYKVSVLFELSLIVSKRSAVRGGSSETVVGELSCGWGVLPLFTSSGKHLKSKKYNLGLFGGSPYESTLSLLVPPEPQTILQSIFRIDKSPRLVIQVWKLSRAQQHRLNKLPTDLVSFLSAIPVLTMYRRLLADKLVGLNNEAKLDTLWSPVLALAPLIMDQVDFFKIFIKQWDLEKKSSTRKELKSWEKMSKKYERALLSIYPLLFIREIPQYSAGDDSLRYKRSKFFTKIASDSMTTTLTSNPAKFSFKPFDSSEGTFDYLHLNSYFTSLSLNGASTLGA